MTKYVISGYIGFDNFGDEAILKVLVAHLKNLNAEEITVLSSNPKKTMSLYNINSVHYLKIFKPIIRSDILISGGGSLLQDITSLKSLIYYLLVIFTALVLRKKVIVFSQGFTPFRTFWGKLLTKLILKHCYKIYVRDIRSQEILQELKIDSVLISDPVFAINTESLKNKYGIGIQLRNFPTLTDSFLQNLAKEIESNFKNQKIKLFSLQDSIDLPILERFAKILKENNIESEIYKNLTVEKALEELTRVEYLIGMRFHSLLVASKSGVKVLGINYDIKVLNLAKSVGFPIIQLKQNSFEKEFGALLSLDTSNYSIPKFDFSKIQLQ